MPPVAPNVLVATRLAHVYCQTALGTGSWLSMFGCCKLANVTELFERLGAVCYSAVTWCRRRLQRASGLYCMAVVMYGLCLA